MVNKPFATNTDKELKFYIDSYTNQLKSAKQGTVGYTRLTNSLALANAALQERGAATPSAPSLTTDQKVADFNAAFSQPSLVNQAGSGLSAGDQLALGMTPTVAEPEIGLANALAGTTAEQTAADAAARDAASAQQAADMQAFSAASAERVKNSGILGNVVGSQGASFEVSNGQINPVGTAVNAQLAQAASDALQAKTRVATTGLDIGKGVVEDTLRTRVRRGIASTIATKTQMSAPLLEKPTLLG